MEEAVYDRLRFHAAAGKSGESEYKDVLKSVTLRRKGLDARRYKGKPIHYTYMVDVELASPSLEKQVLAKFRKDKDVERVEPERERTPAPIRARGEKPPVVVGFGPSGMFAALTLAEAGFSPIVLERGAQIEERQRLVSHFWETGELSPLSNVQFGEGGAGTFSDGKLTTRIQDPEVRRVLEAFVRAGAPEDILYLQKPHLGTDKLRGIVRRIREEIIRLGGTIRFGAHVTGLERKDGKVTALFINDEERMEMEAVFLGIGHSARDTYELLHRSGLPLEAKAFAVGVRIEHPQELIDAAQYREDAGHPMLPAADYALSYQDREAGRGVYSFCMCPGGEVVAAASEKGGVVTNGMSRYARATGIANAALVVTVTPEDFGGDPLAGIAFQRKYEQLAFTLAGGDYTAPVQSVGDFLAGKSGSADFLTTPTYRPRVKPLDLRDCLPGFVTKSLALALPHFDRKIAGFARDDVVMTGIETRTSAPCRIPRNRETLETIGLAGLYPIGEGAGYAGGIMSAAVDGRKAAQCFLKEKAANIFE
ncbi:FAD-dependent oxidoreductase [Selenomonas sp. TAMA-11512]|nr:FAD-dependent oxidoreductase [Selenomonas sp. TAMA-11512]